MKKRIFALLTAICISSLIAAAVIVICHTIFPVTSANALQKLDQDNNTKGEVTYNQVHTDGIVIKTGDCVVITTDNKLYVGAKINIGEGVVRLSNLRYPKKLEFLWIPLRRVKQMYRK